MANAVVCLCLALLAAALPLASAGCWRNGHGPKPRAEEEHYFNHTPSPLLHKDDMPKHFSWCHQKGGRDLCTASWNQHIPIYCGACWAHGTLSMIQDRLKIKKDGRGRDTMLGRQTLLNCAAFEGHGAGCDGGDVIDVMKYMTEHGLPDESCLTYNATDHNKYNTTGDVKECPPEAKCLNCMPVDDQDTCWPIKTPILYGLKSYGKVQAKEGKEQVDHMMSEVYQRGPITCSIACPDDFVWQYHGGIFVDKSNNTDVDHDVEVVGWGEEDGLEYWVVRNSWGTYWGEVGFFRVERGKNALQIEAGDCWYAEPDFEMEKEVLRGDLVGSMYGVEKADKVRSAMPGLEGADAQLVQPDMTMA